MRRRRVLAVGCVALVLGCAGWLIPAVGRVREAAARAKCQGNLKQLALAVHSFGDFHHDLSATIRLSGVPPERRLSWVVAVLPFFEENARFKRFDVARAADQEPNVSAANTGLYRVYCPTSAPVDWWGTKPRYTSLHLHYVGVAGVGADAAELDDVPRRGAFGYDRRSAIPGGFPDGTSNTLLLAETAHAPGPWAVGGWGTVRPVVLEEVPFIGPGRPFGGFHAAERKLFWSSGAMMNAALADGSIRVVHDAIDPAVLAAMATAAGGDPVPGE